MNLQERVNELQAATAEGTPLEQCLLREGIVTVSPHSTPHLGKSSVYAVVLESRRQAIFKSFEGQNPTTCATYRQNPAEAVVHEVVAWRLAHALGGHWEQMVPTAALRDLGSLRGGALINRRAGRPDIAVLDEAAAQVHAAAFWDALIGQQDRHANNFRYDAATKRLALIDNAFAFARSGDIVNGTLFLAHRQSIHAAALSAREMEALDGLLESGDLLGLRRFLADDRADALEARAEDMRGKKRLPLPGNF